MTAISEAKKVERWLERQGWANEVFLSGTIFGTILERGVCKVLKCLDKDWNAAWNGPQKGNNLVPPYWGGTFRHFSIGDGWNDER